MISCEHHDYIEIVCTFRYPIKLTFKSGATLEGIALDTKLNQDRVECIEVDSDGEKRLVILDELSKMEATTDNPHFKSISF